MIWTTATLGFFCLAMGPYCTAAYIIYVTLIALLKLYDWTETHSD